MRTYDRSFRVIARVRGAVSPEDLAAAELELERREAAGQDATIGKVLLEQGKIDAVRLEVIEAAMSRHVFECTKCPAKSYLLPKQSESDVRCDRCGSPTRRVKSTAAIRKQRAIDNYDPGPRGPEPVPEPRAVVPRNAFDPVLPPPVPIKTVADKTLTERLDAVPRPAWIVGAVLSVIVAFLPMKTNMRLLGYDTKIREELVKLNRMNIDAKGKAIEVVKKDGIEPTRDEIQLCLFQDIRFDAHVYAYLTIKSDKLNLQVTQRLTDKEALEIGLASGFEWVKDDKAKLWPASSRMGGSFQILLGCTMALSFVLAAVKLGSSAGR